MCSLADTAKRMLVLKVLKCSCLVVVYISASPFLCPFLFLLRFLLIYILNYFWSPENKWRKIKYKYKYKRTHKNEWGSDHMHTFWVGSCMRVCVCVHTCKCGSRGIRGSLLFNTFCFLHSPKSNTSKSFILQCLEQHEKSSGQVGFLHLPPLDITWSLL